ncbi:TolC family protein [Desulfatirhabdium butyrativorans]|uniref:TolC family protein n=1 Tax=Desulfatirhabdium butyrativorans TaxID=340467 RepID=UPI00040C6CC2|nr:TolC family protein [Desulfatirhabdium butyrativorans]
MKRFSSALAAMVLLQLISGCAVYHPDALDEQAQFPHRIVHLLADTASIPLPKARVCQFNPDDGLDVTEVCILAVVNNPELKLARDDTGIARAQAFSAGLLPNPQLGFGADFPTDNVAGSSYTAFNVGLSYDIRKLIGLNSGKEAAVKKVHHADLTLLWQEWQVIGKARLLFARSIEQRRILQVMDEQRRMLQERMHRTRHAMDEGNVTRSVADADVAVLADIDRRIAESQRKAAATHQELTRLLGLSSDVALNLSGDADVPDIDESGVREALDRLIQRRPDLMALKSGYESQDLRYRQAVLEQFPAIGVGITRANDTSDIHTIGFSLSIELPLFDRNQGKIAVEMATRQRLHDEFEIRLCEARSDIERVMADQKLLNKRLQALHADIAGLEDSVGITEAAYAAGNIDEITCIALRTALFEKRIERIGIEQAALEQRAALQLLLGSDFAQLPQQERNPS